jgi:hypothetical protein
MVQNKEAVEIGHVVKNEKAHQIRVNIVSYVTVSVYHKGE